jgi:glucan phosphoethanolaminetransferase (alkaline phosphatase superfamily)
MNWPVTLLRNRDAFWHAVQDHRLGWRDLLSLALFVVLACGLYGAVLAGWRSPRLSLYVAVKLPLLFLGTIAIVAVFNWMTASILGAALSLRSTVFVALASMTIGCWILLGLVPVSLFFLFTGVSYTGTHDELRYAHNTILMTHIVALAIAGVAGNVALLKGLRRVVSAHCPVHVLFGLWLAAFALVGCQLSWILRPFVGSPFYPVAFVRPDCLDRNFYEFIFTEVLPFLVTGGQ